MPITQHQREQRRKSLGSSDMAAVMGVDPYRTAYDVWLDKTGQLQDQEENPAMDAGKRFEDALIDYAREKLGPIRANVRRVDKRHHLASNSDGQVVATTEPVEGKTAGLITPLGPEWGEPGSDQLPDQYVIQGHVHLACVSADGRELPEACHVPSFLGGRGFIMFRIAADAELVGMIRDAALKFWTDHVRTGRPPEQSEPSLDVAKRILRIEGERVAVDADIAQDWVNAAIDLKHAKACEESARAKLLATMADAEIAIGDGVPIVSGKGGEVEVTYFQQKQRRVDLALLDELYPKAAAACTKVSTFRVARQRKIRHHKRLT